MTVPMNGGLVYRLTFASGKVYIGITTQGLNDRLRGHRAAARAKEPKLAVHRAWKLHGEPIAETLSTHETASELLFAETLAIATHNSYAPGGYNMTWGGETSPAKDPKVLAKIRAAAKSPEKIAKCVAAHTGAKRSDETRANISAALKGKMKGVKFSEDHKRKIAEANRNKPKRVGWTHSDATRKKMSESAYKRWSNR